MGDEQKSKLRLEIAHVLFIDIVGYSKLRINEQSAQIDTLRDIVRGTEQFHAAEAEGKLLRLPSGDGGALAFRNSPEAPVLCAEEIAKALKSHPDIRVRMGIHSGPVNEICDLNEQANMAGAGINIAQRVMDCGDAGHILLSKHVAEDLEHYPRWQPYLHALGECEVKHGTRVGVVNLYADEIGNAQPPKKFQALKKHRARVRWLEAALALIAIAAIVSAFIFVSRRPAGPALTVAEKSIAVLPFENLSDDKQNSYFADGIQDDILTALSKISDLKVISRSSVMRYRDNKRNLREIAHELDVANLLEGSVQRVGDEIRVNAQLIDARTDAHLWAEHYDRKTSDVFAIQSEVAENIATHLRATFLPAEKAAISVRPTSDLEAFDLFLQAKDLIRTFNDTANAKELFSEPFVCSMKQSRETASLPWLTAGRLSHTTIFIGSTTIVRPLDCNWPSHASDRLFSSPPIWARRIWLRRSCFTMAIAIIRGLASNSRLPSAAYRIMPKSFRLPDTLIDARGKGIWWGQTSGLGRQNRFIVGQ